MMGAKAYSTYNNMMVYNKPILTFVLRLG
jgi:hypothetical protein